MQPDHPQLPADNASGPPTKGWKKSWPVLLLIVVVLVTLGILLLPKGPPAGQNAPAATAHQTTSPAYQHPATR